MAFAKNVDLINHVQRKNCPWTLVCTSNKTYHE